MKHLLLKIFALLAKLNSLQIIVKHQKLIAGLLILFSLNSFSAFAQTGVIKYAKTGGNGVNGKTGGVTNTMNMVPFDPNCATTNATNNVAHTVSQTIYKYSEIGTYGVISEVGWHQPTGDFDFGPNDNLQVYLKTTLAATPSSTCDLSQYTLVFNDNPKKLINAEAAYPIEYGWKRVIITPFVYSSTSLIPLNLDVVVILYRKVTYDFPRFTSYFWNDKYSSVSSSPTAIYQSTSPFVSNSSTLTKIVNVPRASFKFSTFSPLPISLLSFDATPTPRGVALNWSTASERNNDYFTISRSSDMENWEEVGTVKGNGSVNYQLDYEFIDIAPLDGISYYQMKQTDYNGENKSFDPVSVEINVENLKNSFIVYPNPTRAGFDVKIHAKEASLAQLSIQSISGKQVKLQDVQLVKGMNVTSMHNEHLDSGVYLVKIAFEDGTTCITKLIVE